MKRVAMLLIAPSHLSTDNRRSRPNDPAAFGDLLTRRLRSVSLIIRSPLTGSHRPPTTIEAVDCVLRTPRSPDQALTAMAIVNWGTRNNCSDAPSHG